jgi:hypothetical protein
MLSKLTFTLYNLPELENVLSQGRVPSTLVLRFPAALVHFTHRPTCNLSRVRQFSSARRVSSKQF